MADHSRFKCRTWEIIGPTRPGDYWSRTFDIFMTSLIATNVLAVMVGTVESVQVRWAWELDVFETVSVVAFSIEYVLSLWACTCDSRYEAPFKGRLKYVISPLALFDLMAILPFFIVFIPLDLRFMRALRLIRALRLFKSARYSAALRTLGRVMRAEKENLIGALLVMFVVLVMSGSLMYFAEKETQPDKFASIPESMWWGVATLFKVRVADMQPITTLGRVLAAFLAFWGVALVAVPAGILSSGFIMDMRRSRNQAQTCPHCGKPLESDAGMASTLATQDD